MPRCGDVATGLHILIGLAGEVEGGLGYRPLAGMAGGGGVSVVCTPDLPFCWAAEGETHKAPETRSDSKANSVVMSAAVCRLWLTSRDTETLSITAAFTDRLLKSFQGT